MKKEISHIQASILDRLIDLEPKVSKESVQYRTTSFREIKSFVIRDLENLLNSRRSITDIPAAYKTLRRSIAGYGLKDFTADNPNSAAVMNTIRRDVEKTISRFEPRLKNVKVQLEKGEKTMAGLSFRISGLLVLDPIREPVTFDTYFDASRSEYVILK